jgi:hypothetical protein
MYTQEYARALRSMPEVARLASSSNLFNELKSNRKTLDIDGETLYVLEGDVLLDETQLEIYALQQEALHQAHTLGLPVGTESSRELLGILVNGRIVRWPVGKVLSYAVLRQTFSNNQYQEIVAAMTQATATWENTCGVKFEHRSQFDNNAPGAPLPQVLFTVRRVSGAPFIAAAFFPNDPANRRRVLIDQEQYFNLPSPPAGFDRVGVLRHELGHVIGWRHEHIRSGAPAVCPDEPLFETTELTDYDPQSVMHYFCGNRGTRDLRITEKDRIGSQLVYGPPLTAIEFVEIPEGAG